MRNKPALGVAMMNYGKGVVEIDDDRGAFVEVEFTSAIESVIERDDWQPPTLPRVALDVMALTQKPSSTIEDLLNVLEQDPLIAARVLRIAQSPLFSCGSPLSSMHQAVVRLGLQGVRDIVVQVSLGTKLFRHPVYGEVLDGIWRHSRRVAHLARMVSNETPFPSEHAFIAGLMHDVGTASALLVAAELNVAKNMPLTAVLGAANSIHEKAGARLVGMWGFPSEYVFAVKGHHALFDQGQPNPHAAILIVAESLDDGAPSLETRTAPSVVFEATKVLGFNDHDATRLIHNAKQILAKFEA